MPRKITYGIDFDIDKSSLQQLRNQLQDLGKITQKELKLFNPETTQKELKVIQQQVQEAAQIMGTALDSAYNPKLDTLNISKFSQSLSNSSMSIREMESAFAKAGTAGKNAFLDLTSQVLTTQRAVKQTSGLIESMAQTLTNTIKWTVASSAIQTFTGAIQKAWGFTQKLDESLNNIRIVTGKSVQEMDAFATKANKAAKALGTTTTNYTNAALIFYQQGLGEEDVQARASTTIKAANVTGQSAAEVSEQLTAVWNGYKVVAEEAELYVDKLAAVAANTAADLEELSTGMSKVASAAAAMGVDINQLSAQLATIVSVTRQDASVVGTSLKTIFARMGDLKVDGLDEFGVSLGEVSSQMKQMGINVLDQEGNLRDMGTIIEEVAEKWGTWTEAQQQAAAVAIAGKRQYNNLIALFENWDMYENALITSQTSEGTLQEQQDTYMDSLEGRLSQLKSAGEGVYEALFDSESMKDFIQILTGGVEAIDNLISGIGGGGNLLLMITSSLGSMLSGQIAGGVSRIVSNMGIWRSVAAQTRAETEITTQYTDAQEDAIRKLIALKEQGLSYGKLMNEEEELELNSIIRQTAELEKQKRVEEEKLEKARETYELLTSPEVARALNTKQQGNYNSAAQTLEGVAEDREYEVKSVLDDSSYRGYRKSAEKMMTSVGLSPVESTQLLSLKGDELQQQAAIYQSQGQEGEQKLAIIEKLVIAENEYKKMVFETIQVLDSLSNAEDLSKEQRTQLSAASKALTEDESKLYEVQRTLASVTNTSVKALRDQGAALRTSPAEINKLNKSLKSITKVAKDFFKSLNFKAAIKGITQVASAAGQLGSIIGSLANIGDIINDEELEPWEKFSQIVSVAGSSLSMLTLGASSLINGIKGISTALGLSNTLWAVNNRLKKASSDEQKISIITDYLKATSQMVEGKAVEYAGQQYLVTNGKLELYNGEKKEALVLDAAQTTSQGVVAATTKVTGEVAEEAGNKMAAAWLKALVPIGLIIAAIAAVIAIVTALLAAFGAFDKKEDAALKKAKENFKDVQESAKKFAEELQNAKKEYTDLLDKIENYEKARKAIDSLTEGTTEWNEAILSANQQVMELMSQYPSLAEHITSDNGILTIDQEGLDLIQSEQQNKIREATLKNTSITISQYYAKTDLKRSELGAKIYEDTLEDANKKTAKSLQEGVTKALTNLDSDNLDVSAISKANDVNTLRTALGLVDTTAYDDATIKALLDNKEALVENVKAIEEQTVASDALKSAYLKTLYGDDEIADSEVFANTTQDIVDAESLSVINKLNNEYNTSLKKYNIGEEFNTGWFGTLFTRDRKNALDLADSWIKEAGYSHSLTKKDFNDVKTQEDFLNKEITITDAEGKTQTLTLKDIRDKAIQGEIAQETKDATKVEYDRINALSQAGYSTDLNYFYEGNKITDWKNRSLADLTTLENSLINVTDSTDIQGRTAGDLKASIRQEQAAQRAAINTMLSKLDLNNSFSTDDFSYFSEQDRTDFTNTIDRIQDETIKNNYINLLKSFQNNPEELARVAGLGTQVDWKDKNAVANFFFSQNKDAQINLRKKELDYYKNINAELDKVNEKLDKVIGKEKELLLQRQVALEKEAQIQAKTNVANAKQAFDAYAVAYGYNNNDYMNADGSLNIIALNDAIAKLDPNKESDKEEIDRLNELLSYWEDILDKEQVALESSYKIIDAQIALVKEQVAANKELIKTAQSWRSFRETFKLSEQGKSLSWSWNDFAEKTSAEAVQQSLNNIRNLSTDLGFNFNTLSHYSDIADSRSTSLVEGLLSGKGFTQAMKEAIYWTKTEYANDGNFNSAAFKSDFSTELEEARTILEEMQSELQNMYESYLNAQDELLEIYDKEIEKLKTINSIYSGSANLAKMVGATGTNYYSLIVQNAQSNFEYAKAQMATIQQEFEKINKEGVNASEEMLNKVAENLAQASENAIETAQEVFSAIADEFTNALANEINKALGGDLVGLSEEWDLALAKEEGYLDEVNATYGIDQLSRNIQKSIDETTNLDAQKKLNDLRIRQEQRLNEILTQRGKLSQYELDRANAEYELTLKQIALEEAQQTANKMKLTRDAWGNYTYQYVTDESAIAQAEEELATAKNNLYNLDKERNQSLVSEYYATMTEANEKIAEAFAAGDEERVERLREHYFGGDGMLASIQAELGASSTFLQEIGEMVSGTSFTSNIQQVAEELSKMDLAGENGLFANVNSLIEGSTGTLQSFENSVKTLLTDEKVGLGTITSSIATTSNNLKDLAPSVKDLSDTTSAIITNMGPLVTNVQTLASQLDRYANSYSTWLEDQTNTDAINANTSAVGELTAAVLLMTDKLDGQADGDLSRDGYRWDPGTQSYIFDQN